MCSALVSGHGLKNEIYLCVARLFDGLKRNEIYLCVARLFDGLKKEVARPLSCVAA